MQRNPPLNVCQTTPTTMGSTEVVKRAECGCCGMWEDCTLGYIAHVKERFGGNWVCGLCAEAIKEEQSRFGLGVEAALQVHARFRETAHTDPTTHIARSILHLLKKIISSSSANPAAKFSFPAKTTTLRR